MEIKTIGKEKLLIDGDRVMILKDTLGRTVSNAKMKKRKFYNPEKMKNGWDRFDSMYPSNPKIEDEEEEY